tara:strand:+ start:362 stop:1834 length:1473 start_codon:yes stop_codon:yes gene_type:complete
MESHYKNKLFDHLKNYTEEKFNKSEDMTINASRLLDVFRSVNYKLSQSTCDIIDNSIDINADTIEVSYNYDPVNFDRYLMVVDNGRGMTEKEIQNAMMLGSDRKRDDKELGKFGIGLKLSSLAQAREVTVISKPLKGIPQIRRISYDYIKKKKKLELLKSIKDESLLETISSNLDKYKSGTIVLLQDMDKKNRNFNLKDEQLRWYKELNHLKECISMVYHRYLEGNNIANKKINIIYNNIKLEPLDPTLSMFKHNESNPDGTLLHTVIAKKAEGKPKVTLCIHPRRDILNSTNKGKEILDRLQVVEKSDTKNQGFYFYRNDRLITRGGWGYTFYDRTPHNSLNLARVIVDLKEEHDDMYDIEPTKTDYDPPNSFKDTIDDILGSTYAETNWHNSFIKKAQKRHAKKTKKTTKKKATKKLKTTLKQTKNTTNNNIKSPQIETSKQLTLDFTEMPYNTNLVFISDLSKKIIINTKHLYYDEFVKLFKQKLEE